MTNYTTKEENKNTGNNCGHCPSTPRYFIPPEKHANRPVILSRIITAIRKYYENPNTLPLLNAANESDRQQRSERREACISLLGCILHYTDLVTLRVGIPQPDGSMAGLTLPFIADLSGLGERRAERAIHDLKAAGIITVHPICEKISDTVYKAQWERSYNLTTYKNSLIKSANMISAAPRYLLIGCQSQCAPATSQIDKVQGIHYRDHSCRPHRKDPLSV